VTGDAHDDGIIGAVKRPHMIGAIAGDVIGSVYEGGRPLSRDFPLFEFRSRFTDDTVLSVAVASAIMGGEPFDVSIRRWGSRYPTAGYGYGFSLWMARDEAGPYNSFGNGSAMRVAPVGWAFDNLEDVLHHAAASAEVTHNHPEGIKGAQAVAAAVFAGRTGQTKNQIAALLSDTFGYDCSMDMRALQKRGGYDVTCQGTVPVAAAAFLQSTDFEDAVRNAVSIGGDTDTLACIAGAIAEAFYGGVPAAIQAEALSRLDVALLNETSAFVNRYVVASIDRTCRR
jgi:ADP-ribosylglycohydrolase